MLEQYPDMKPGISNNHDETTYYDFTQAIDNDIVSDLFNSNNTDVRILIKNCEQNRSHDSTHK